MNVVRVRNLTGTPLERMLFLEMITEEEYNILDDMLADMYRMGHMGLRASNTDGTPRGGATNSTAYQELYASVNARLHLVGQKCPPGTVDCLYNALHSHESLENRKRLARAASYLKQAAVVISASSGRTQHHRQLPL